MKKLLMSLALLTTATSSFAYERTVDYKLDSTDCEDFRQDLGSLTGYNELSDVSVKIESCTNKSNNWGWSSSIEATLKVDFKTCDTDTYTIKSYKTPSYNFLDGSGLANFLPALGLRPLGHAPEHRSLYGIPFCE